MQHIHEGIQILEWIRASDETISAYMLHPIFQADDDVAQAFIDPELDTISAGVMLLVMEYRNKANAYLCRPETDNYTLADLPTLPVLEVRDMLIADKVQNRKDFELHHKGTHPRSDQLDSYFKLWLQHLGIEEKTYQDWVLRLSTLSINKEYEQVLSRTQRF